MVPSPGPAVAVAALCPRTVLVCCSVTVAPVCFGGAVPAACAQIYLHPDPLHLDGSMCVAAATSGVLCCVVYLHNRDSASVPMCHVLCPGRG